jgi:hypothetical protein
MRVLRLGLGDDRAVDLHPAASVVTGLTDDQRTALRRGFTAIGTGLSPSSAGLVEAHGLLLDATQDDLDLLDVPSTATATVATVAEVPGAIPEDDADRLRTAERDLLLLAADRWRAGQDLARTEAARVPDPPTGDDRARLLRARIARHEARDPEPLRVALDRVRDAGRTWEAPEPTELIEALAGLGLDTADLGLPLDELVRMAEDWLDERRREADWVVGALVELQGIEDALAAGALPGAPPAADLDELRLRASRAAVTHSDAVTRADELRAQLVASHAPRPAADQLQEHLVARLSAHRPARLAGAVPLVLDGVLGHLDDGEATSLLDRVAGLAGSVQLVVVDDHPAAAAWAEAAGILRAALVGPVDSAEEPAPPC